MTLFDISSAAITKHISGLVRAMVNVSKTIIVWSISLILTICGIVDWEILETEVIFLQLLGFTLLVIGNLVFYDFIKFGTQDSPLNDLSKP